MATTRPSVGMDHLTVVPENYAVDDGEPSADDDDRSEQ